MTYDQAKEKAESLGCRLELIRGKFEIGAVLIYGGAIIKHIVANLGKPSDSRARTYTYYAVKHIDRKIRRG